MTKACLAVVLTHVMPKTAYVPMLFTKALLRRFQQCYIEVNSVAHCPCSESGSFSVQHFPPTPPLQYAVEMMLSVWLIIVLCNHSNYCVSQRNSGMNLNERNLLAISPKPCSRWTSISSGLWLKKEDRRNGYHLHFPRNAVNSKWELCHSCGWVLLSPQREIFENPGHMNATFTGKKGNASTALQM